MHRQTQLLALLLAIVLAVSACNSAAAANPSPTSAAPDKVILQLNWIHDNAWSGFYMAEKNNLYRQENLEVEMRTVFDEQGNFIDTKEAVRSGQAHFGIISADNLLVARANGLPLVAVATIYQQHPLALVSLSDKNIVRPQDLIGARVHVSPNSQIVFDALLASQNIAANQLQEIERTDYSTQPLFDGSADVIDAWVTNELPLLDAAQQPYNAIFLSDYGIEMYPNLIFTTEELILTQPKLVERFVRATVGGLRAAVDDPERAAQLTVEYNAELKLGEQQEAARHSLPLIKPAGSEPGMMTPEAWETAQSLLLDLGVLSEPVDLSAAYTLTFLNKVYPERAS